MIMLAKILYISTILLTISIPANAFWPIGYKLQKTILEKVTPRSDSDYSRLIINSFISGFSVWCAVFAILSLIEKL